MLKIGDKAPALRLPSGSGDEVALSQLKGQPVVLYFYPRDMTPGCTVEACDFRDAKAKLKKRGVVVLGVSRDSAESHARFAEKHELDFTLLADEAGEACKAYGVWKQKSLYGRKFMGIERTTFVIGKTGKIARVFSKVKVKGHVDEVLAAIDELS